MEAKNFVGSAHRVWIGSTILLAFVLQVPAASLLSNTGFESDPGGHNQNLPGWQIYGANVYNETSASVARGGTNYFKVYQAFNGSVNYSGIYQDYIASPGASYSADGWTYTANSDALAGQNIAWIEVSFRDAPGNMLALYRSALITTNVIASGAFPKSQWVNLPITNQYDPSTFQLTGTVSKIVAPPGTVFLRYQIVFQGDANNSGGSIYFDDLNLVQTSHGDMNIVWSDEFDGVAIKTNIWTYDIGNGGSNPGWGNQEREYYTSRTNNAFVADGLLHIVARKESFGGFHYTSARMKSQGLFASQYGRIEWRAQLPQGVGFWPALWLLGTNITSIGWPGCGEIDVMENVGSNPLMAQASIHSGSSSTAIYNFIDGEQTTNFNTYTMDWMPNAFLFYVNGHLYQTRTNWSSSAGSYPFPFNQPFFMIMNLAIGGQYIGNPTTNAINSGTTFPGEMLVDYVRISKVTEPFRIAIKQSGTHIILSWPSNIFCRLQAQTNGFGTDWFTIQTTTNQLQVTPNNGSAFYRLVMP
jgi:beta-glucanase (GH16 family)